MSPMPEGSSARPALSQIGGPPPLAAQSRPVGYFSGYTGGRGPSRLVIERKKAFGPMPAGDARRLCMRGSSDPARSSARWRPMRQVERFVCRDEGRIASAVSRQAAAEARWLTRASLDQGRPLTEGEREQRIKEVAYFRAQRRGFAPGHEIEDWLAAEEEIDNIPRFFQ
ncbi:hypothetical protein CKO22_09120 [Thiococcus pfennigii]|nr:hypothetical protein [Thiococcus pfennigii]